MSQTLFKKILIIGLGLIGGSFARAMRQNQVSSEIFAFDLDEEILELAKSDAVIDDTFSNIEALLDEIKNFDLIILATPLSTYESILKTIAPEVAKTTTIIDLGSVKDFKNIIPKNLQNNFILCHPIAGLEENGYENSKADLFLDKKLFICPENHEKEQINKIKNLAKKIGAVPDLIDAKKHDEIYALVSHLPQFLSFLTKDFSPKNIKDAFLAKAFRLDNSAPEIWSDIFEFNEKNLEKFYVKFFENLEKFEANLSLVFSKKAQENSSNFTIDENYLKENFAEIFTRLVIVSSFLKIKEIDSFKDFAGEGFKDFTSITQILSLEEEKLKKLLKENQAKILKFLKSL